MKPFITTQICANLLSGKGRAVPCYRCHFVACAAGTCVMRGTPVRICLVVLASLTIFATPLLAETEVHVVGTRRPQRNRWPAAWPLGRGPAGCGAGLRSLICTPAMTAHPGSGRPFLYACRPERSIWSAMQMAECRLTPRPALQSRPIRGNPNSPLVEIARLGCYCYAKVRRGVIISPSGSCLLASRRTLSCRILTLPPACRSAPARSPLPHPLPRSGIRPPCWRWF